MHSSLRIFYEHVKEAGVLANKLYIINSLNLFRSRYGDV